MSRYMSRKDRYFMYAGTHFTFIEVDFTEFNSKLYNQVSKEEHDNFIVEYQKSRVLKEHIFEGWHDMYDDEKSIYPITRSKYDRYYILKEMLNNE